MLLFTAVIIISCAPLSIAQSLPEKIRGYKVHNAEIEVNGAGESDAAVLTVGAPALSDVSVTGITLDVPVEVDKVEQDGTVDFISFRDFTINGIAVEIEEYRAPFLIQKGRKTVLPEPASIFVGIRQAARAALEEMTGPKAEWTVTGRVFVFGRFRKFGFEFKRVIPIDIKMKVRNPLLETDASPDQNAGQ